MLEAKALCAALSDEGADAGVTITTQWEPLAGPGAPVKPAVYAGPRYQFAQRWWQLDGEWRRVTTVSLDSVPSQANRLEAALKQHRGELGLPELVLDLGSVGALPVHLPRVLSSFELPHRNADAYLRDAQLDGQPFLKSSIGQEIFSSSADVPEGLLRWMPQALLYGFWQSHLGKKQQQTKWARVWTSELYGIDPAVDVSAPVRTLGTKGDPLNLSIDVALEFDENDTTTWEVTENAGKRAAGQKSREALSNLGHGQVPFKEAESALLGVSCRAIEQRATLSFAGLRRIAAPASARGLLAAIGLAAHQAAFGRAVQLRSGCALRPVAATWMWLGATGGRQLEVPPLEGLVGLAAELAAAAEADGMPVGSRWQREPVVLTPSGQLAKVIRLSWPASEDA